MRVVDDGRGIPVDMHPVEKQARRRDGHDRAARGRQVRQRLLRGLRRSARRRRLGGQRAVHARWTWRSTPTATSGASTTRARCPARCARARHDQADRHHGHLLGRPDIFETTDLQHRDDPPPAAGDGLPQQGPHHRAARRAQRRPTRRRGARRRGLRGEGQGVHLLLPQRPRGLRRAPEQVEGPDPQEAGRFTGRGRRATRSRSRCSGTPATPSRSTPSPTRSTPTRAAPTRRASARR